MRARQSESTGRSYTALHSGNKLVSVFMQSFLKLNVDENMIVVCWLSRTPAELNTQLFSLYLSDVALIEV